MFVVLESVCPADDLPTEGFFDEFARAMFVSYNIKETVSNRKQYPHRQNAELGNK